MPGTPKTYYKDFVGTQEGFDKFHTQVINMPRDAFEGAGLDKLRFLAAYLIAIANITSQNGNTYKEFMGFMAKQLYDNPNSIQLRDIDFENTYLNFEDLDIHYDEPSIAGRMFRHLMGLCAFFGMIKSQNKVRKTINIDRCKDFVELQLDQITPFTSNVSLNINIKDNDFITNLKGIEDIKSNADYHPTLAILKYMKEIGREVTDFEISALLARVDNLQNEQLIFDRALEIGRWFQSNTRNGQQQEFFRDMRWIDTAGNLFRYKSSQQPWFKFRTYILFLEAFGLIEKNTVTKNYSLTQDASDLLGDLPATIIDLNKIINKLDLEGGGRNDVTMKDVLIKANIDTLKALVADQNLIKKINRFVIDNPIMKTDGTRRRNQFIAELARIRENYQCQAGTTTFERQDGRNYVEAHHIIEFSKNGPDILENLLALGPTPHSQLHLGSERAIRDMYINLMTRGAIQLGLFEKMIDEYNCLDSNHLDFLHLKGIISSQQKVQLQEKISNQASVG